MFRARNHEGVAADVLFDLVEFIGGRRVTGERKLRVYTACAVIAHKLIEVQRGGG